jgi:hypothetical protein
MNVGLTGGIPIRTKLIKKLSMNLIVQLVESISQHMETRNKSIVLTFATFKLAIRMGGEQMNKEHRINVENYYASLIQLKRMLTLNIISIDDFVRCERIIADKHCIKVSSIYRSNDLIDSSLNGNIITKKGVI